MTHTALPVNHRAKMCSKPLLVVFVALLALRNAYGTREDDQYPQDGSMAEVQTDTAGYHYGGRHHDNKYRDYGPPHGYREEYEGPHGYHDHPGYYHGPDYHSPYGDQDEADTCHRSSVGCDLSGPSLEVGIATSPAPSRDGWKPNNDFKRLLRKPAPTREDDLNAEQVCAANPAFEDLGPSNTVCKLNMNIKDYGFSACTVWFISPTLMLTAGHCVADLGSKEYYLNTTDPGFACCDVQPDGSCASNAVFNVRAWVTTKGWKDTFSPTMWPMGEANDGAVLLVEPAPTTTVVPKPQPIGARKGPLPRLNISMSGFPCSDDRFEGCDSTNIPGSDLCTVHRGYAVTNALPILSSNNNVGSQLIYIGSSCGGNSGGPIIAEGEGFGILVSGPTFDCSLTGGQSGSTYSMIVDKCQAFGVYVGGLIKALRKATKGSN